MMFQSPKRVSFVKTRVACILGLCCLNVWVFLLNLVFSPSMCTTYYVVFALTRDVVFQQKRLPENEWQVLLIVLVL